MTIEEQNYLLDFNIMLNAKIPKLRCKYKQRMYRYVADILHEIVESNASMLIEEEKQKSLY